MCVMALGAATCLANQDWANRSVKNPVLGSVESDIIDSLLTESDINFHAARVDVHPCLKMAPKSGLEHRQRMFSDVFTVCRGCLMFLKLLVLVPS